MKRFLLVLVAVFMAAQPVLTRAASGAESITTKIGYVDMDRAVNECAQGKEARAELEALMKRLQGDISRKTTERDRIKSELDKKWAALSTEARREKADDLDRAERERQRTVSDAEAEMQKKQRDKQDMIKGELLTVINEIGKTENYTIILPLDAILYSKDSNDLTKQVIDKMDAEKAEKDKAAGGSKEKQEKAPAK